MKQSTKRLSTDRASTTALFDAAAVTALPPQGQLHVPGTEGLYLRRRRDPEPLPARAKRAAWVHRFKFGGRRYEMRLGFWPALPPSEALRLWQSDRDSLDRGHLPSRILSRESVRRDTEARRKERANNAADPTLGALLNDHWALLEQRSDPPKSRRKLRGLFEKHFPEEWRKRRASALTKADAESWLLQVGSSAHGSARILYERWRTIWRTRFDGTGPWIRTPSLAPVLKVRRRKRVLTDAELARWVRWLPEASLSPAIKDALALAIYTGARSGEIVGMSWSRLDLERTHYALPEEATKTKEPRNLMLSPIAVEILARRRASAGPDAKWVFPSIAFADRPMLQSSLWNGLDEAQRAAGFDKWTVHDLRRTVRTGLSRLGCPFEVCELVLGHKLGGVAAHYAHHAFEREQLAWLTKWQKHLTALAAGNVVQITTAKRMG